MENEVSFFWKLSIALCAGVFGVAVAISIQHIKIIGVPKWLVVFAIVVQLLLSWGVFIFVMIFFKSGLLPEVVPNDEYSALSVAYFCASIPHIVITTAILIYNKEINKWLESRYGSGEVLPNMDKHQNLSKQDEREVENQAQTTQDSKNENLQTHKGEMADSRLKHDFKRDEIKSHEVQTYESVVGVGDIQGGGSDFAIQAPPPCKKEKGNTITHCQTCGQSLGTKDDK